MNLKSYREKYTEDNKRQSKSEPQRVFQEVVERFIDDQYNMMRNNPEMGEEFTEKYFSRERISQDFPYRFHDDSSVASDGALYSVLNYGESDYGYGSGLREEIDAALEDAGYYLENYGMGVFNFEEL